MARKKIDDASSPTELVTAPMPTQLTSSPPEIDLRGLAGVIGTVPLEATPAADRPAGEPGIVDGDPEASSLYRSGAEPGCYPSVELGTELANVLASADRETISNSRAMIFESANAPTEKPIDKRIPGLVARTFAPLDFDVVLDRFDAWMALGDRRTELAFVRKAHEEGPEILGLIQDMHIQVKFAQEAWELDNYTMLGTMREQASEVLEAEKAKKIRTKTITIDDVTNKAAAMFPDEYAAQEKQRRQFALAVERTKHCVERATIRCKHLDSMVRLQ